jgi:glycosyltransferase involved in cell wall biosynthesis
MSSAIHRDGNAWKCRSIRRLLQSDRKIYLTTDNGHSKPRVLLAATIAPTIRAFLLPLARHFKEKGWRVDAMANGIEKDDVCRPMFERVWEAEWDRNPLLPRNVTMAERIRKLVIEHQYDIVHVHTPVAAFVTRLGLKGLRHKQQLQVVYTAHGFHFHPMGGAVRNKIFELLERKAANWTDFLVVLNRDDFRAAKEKQLIGPDRLRLMPGIGVDRSRYSSLSISQGEVNKLYVELGISPGTPLLLMVAEFTQRKRHVDAIRAFSGVVHPDAHLVLVGSGPLFEPMKRLAAELGVGERIHFLGSRNDVPVLMKASRAVILPSIQEGLPRCILEAMSMGIPVIGSRIRGTTELLERNAGVLVDVGDIEQLTHAMQSLLDDSAAAGAMGETGLQQSEAYDLSHILRMHEELYEEALKLRRSPVTNTS